jgi:hypothetical protein
MLVIYDFKGEKAMKNNSKSIITIEMNHVDHAVRLTESLRSFFSISDQGGDSSLAHISGGGVVTDCGMIGHDVRRPIISIEFPDAK